MINIEIDGKKLEAEPGSVVIAAADKAGIYIPRFCYHKKLSIAANCRMCLVEVEKSGKPLPACATPVTEGMKVFTRSKIALEAQKSVMEFLLINHPLDCPICDQGGECELQDLSLEFGADASRYTEGKRSIKDKDIGSLISTCMTRCIQCTRCVRFGREVAGLPELGATGRGENLEIGTYIEHSLMSEVSGNIIDLCPVGALLSKPFKFSARAWELNQQSSIAPHDCLGSNIHLHTRRNSVMRVAPQENEVINETWLSDRDRFSYEGLNSPDRLQKPLVKKAGVWEETDWQTALNITVHGLQNAIQGQGADKIGALISPNSTLEEMYLLQKLWQGLGSYNLDHRLRQLDFSHACAPVMECTLPDLEHQEVILLIGSNIRHEQPLASLRIRKAALQGAKIFCINPVDVDFNFPVTEKYIVHPDKLMQQLHDKELIKQLTASQNSVLILGAIAEQHPQAGALRALAEDIAKRTGSKLVCFTEGANTAGAWATGALPQKNGLNTQAMFEKQLKAYLLVGIEPELDCANPALAQKALKNADFVVALSPFKSEALLNYAHVILPIAPFSETSGTFVNVTGHWQSFKGAVSPLGETRPGWKVLRVLGNLFDLTGFEYQSSEEVRTAIIAKESVTEAIPCAVAPLAMTSQLYRIGPWPMYRVDNVVRRSEPLQKCAAAEKPIACMNAATAKKLQLSAHTHIEAIQGEGSAHLFLTIDERMPDDCVYIPSGFPETANLGPAFGPVELRV